MKQNHLHRSVALLVSGAACVLVLDACNKAPAPAAQNAVSGEAQNLASADTGAPADTSAPPEPSQAQSSAPAYSAPAAPAYRAPAHSAPAAAPSLPLDQSPPATPAPPVAALPPVPPAPVAPPPAPVQQYQYVDQAAAMSAALASAPPNYAVEYQGAKPWVWRAPNGGYRIVETVPGGQRTYFYAAGARVPYLVRDPQFSYAFQGGRLVVVYSARGQALPPAVAARQAAAAGRYLQRAQWLHDAAMNGRRESASAADWRAHQATLAAQRAAWEADRQHNADWRAWEAQHGALPAPNGPPPPRPGANPPPPRPVNPPPGPRPSTPAADQRTRDAERLHQAQTRVLSARQALADAQARTVNMPPAERHRIVANAQAKVDQAVAAQSRVQAAVDAHK